MTTPREVHSIVSTMGGLPPRLSLEGERFAFGGGERHAQKFGDGGRHVEVGNLPGEGARANAVAAGDEQGIHLRVAGQVSVAAALLRNGGGNRAAGGAGGRISVLDRKSTRLNSSH